MASSCTLGEHFEGFIRRLVEEARADAWPPVDGEALVDRMIAKHEAMAAERQAG